MEYCFPSNEDLIDWLEALMDIGLSENDFWNMSISELERYHSAYINRKENEEKEMLTYLHILGDLIGMSCARIHNRNAKYPKKYELFPEVFQEEMLADSINTLLNFASYNNQKFKEQEEQNDDLRGISS